MNDAKRIRSDLTDHSGLPPRLYSAFISYTDADRTKAIKLQARLERYRLPARLARQVGFNRIKPVFLDRSEMRAASDLGGAIREALSHSDFLIVLCTPHTPHSHWVGREIDTFRELHGDEHILVALFDGEKRDCFHPCLMAGRGEYDAEPLAADFRKQGDGPRLALLKLMASLVGLNLDDLYHRDAKRQRQLQLVSGSIAVVLVLAFTTLTYVTYNARASAVEQQIAASRAMERQLQDLREKIKAGGTLDMAAAVNRNVELFYDGQPASSQLPAVELGRAQVLQAEADDDLLRGKLDEAAASARSAWKISSNVLSREPTNTKAIFVHAQSAFWVAAAAWQQDDAPLAANAFARYADLADKLVKADPKSPEWLMEQGEANVNLGILAIQYARDPIAAQRYLEKSVAAFRGALERKPGDEKLEYELQKAEGHLADAAVMRGNLDGARRYRANQARLLNGLRKREPENRDYLKYHLTNETGQARLDAAQGKFSAALRKLRAQHVEADALEAADPENLWLAGLKRNIELFEAQFELQLATSDRRALARAEKLLGDCTQDWRNPISDEMAVFCNILAAHASLIRGNRTAAQRIMADPRLAKWLGSPSLSKFMRVDFKAECRKLGDPALCKVDVAPPG